jgi:hypothetical protein
MSEQQQGITDSQLFQQFTKSNQVCTNSFQLLFDTSVNMQKQIDFLTNLLKANGVKIPETRLPQGTTLATVAEPNRQQRRKAEREAKKNDKPAK